ncbi:hypothetical protein E1B28_001098 [Marasmius oreades]|uniref:Uncharacterized protein n=1 Tax=Marasmius oreades TaxID=181124 RepID=A0A9P7V2R1_9AGAR|nr:uncharacterized protein E1B28_001098 [Marasmius oreades]KAG7099233.1 hypothetical protein E1B28_001098 [Marasmius oreades]
MSSSYASFAPYMPPPDDPTYPTQSQSTSKKPSRPWFPSQRSEDTSYQSGGVPTFNNSVSGGYGSSNEAESQRSQWETRFGMRVDLLAAFAYILGPLSALLVLILETQNDFVRFHGYQSALLTGPLLLIRMLISFSQFSPWFRTIFTLCIICCQVYMGFAFLISKF